MPEWDGVERRKYQPVRRQMPRLIRSVVELSRQLWLDYLRRGIARPGDLATMAADLRASARKP